MGLFDKLFGKQESGVLTAGEKQLCEKAGLTAEDGMLFKKLTQQPLQELTFISDESEIPKPTIVTSWASNAMALKIVSENLEHFRSQGKYIFIYGYENGGFTLGLTGATSDPYLIMEYCETNGINFDIETKHIIEKFKKWDSEFGIITIGIGFDYCECIIQNTNIDFAKLAEEVYEFCPDVVEQGTLTVEDLEKEMKKSKTIYLWWD